MNTQARGFGSIKARSLVAALVLLGSAAALSAENRKFPCNAGGRVFQATLPTNGVFPVTLMWTKPTPDNDIFLFDPVSGQLLGIGIGLAERYEHVAIAGLTGLPVDIFIIKASGPNSQCVLHWTGELTEGPPPSRIRALRYLGTVDDLADRSPKYAQMKATVEAWQSLKRPQR